MNKSQSKTVYVGMSGGVDSSVCAALLVEQGYRVVGVYMKNWSKDLPGFPCPWKEDYQDAKRVAVKLGIPFEMWDFETEYFDKVVQYMLDGFKEGITPNPDIMCNQEIKFKLFYETAREKGADYIATGHYARVRNSVSTKNGVRNPKNATQLLKAKDDNKDQTYFLYRITEDALAHTLFPLGDMTKPEVRKEAEKRGLITANKKESMGICFVGKVGIKEFLSQYVETKPGNIVNADGRVVGQHEGAIYYTIGQRHGLDVGGGLPYYVTGKDMQKNEVYVTNDISDESLWSKTIKLTKLHWINETPVPAQMLARELKHLAQQGKEKSEAHWASTGRTLQVRTRHRAKLINCSISYISKDRVEIKLNEQIRALTPGQSAVLYDEDVCIGGGIIA